MTLPSFMAPWKEPRIIPLQLAARGLDVANPSEWPRVQLWLRAAGGRLMAVGDKSWRDPIRHLLDVHETTVAGWARIPHQFDPDAPRRTGPRLIYLYVIHAAVVRGWPGNTLAPVPEFSRRAACHWLGLANNTFHRHRGDYPVALHRALLLHLKERFPIHATLRDWAS